MYCKYCGKAIDNDSRFCSYCGKELADLKVLMHDILAEKKVIEEDSISHNGDLLKKLPKYDINYPREPIAAIVAIIIMFLYLYIFYNFNRIYLNIENFIGYLTVLNLLWRIFVVFWCYKIARRQNRSVTGWGFLAFLLPILALLILGRTRRILINSVIRIKYREHEYKMCRSNFLFSFAFGSYEEFEFKDETGRTRRFYRIRSSNTFFVLEPEAIRFKNLDDYFVYLAQINNVET